MSSSDSGVVESELERDGMVPEPGLDTRWRRESVGVGGSWMVCTTAVIAGHGIEHDDELNAGRWRRVGGRRGGKGKVLWTAPSPARAVVCQFEARCPLGTCTRGDAKSFTIFTIYIYAMYTPV